MCAGSNYPFLTRKERDNETGLDFFEARYYSSTQGRFASVDPYNVVLETEVTATTTSPEKAAAEFLSYLSRPQGWNRYVYVGNNPLKYVDPTGEQIELTGSAADIQAAFERFKDIVGEKAAKLLYLRTENGHTYVDYHGSRGDDKKEVDALVAADTSGSGVYFAKMINDKDPANTVEFRVAESFQTKDGSFTTAYFGGAATIGKEESLRGHAQIFVNPKAGDLAQNWGMSMLGISSSSNGKQLDFWNDVVDAHEFGHAYANVYEGASLKHSNASNRRSLNFENGIRARRGLSNRRIKH